MPPTVPRWNVISWSVHDSTKNIICNYYDYKTKRYSQHKEVVAFQGLYLHPDDWIWLPRQRLVLHYPTNGIKRTHKSEHNIYTGETKMRLIISNYKKNQKPRIIKLTLTSRLKADFFWAGATTASVKDWAALLNSTCNHD